MDNYQIADQFSLLSKLMDIHGENSFKSKSYASAAFAIEKLPMPLSEIAAEKIAEIKGIGSSSAQKIIELLQTGKLDVLEKIILSTPPGVIEMLNIKGIGPKKINTIWKEMELETLGELLYACKENRLKLYKGFGEKTQQSVIDNIEFYFKNKGSFLYAQVEDAVQLIEMLLSKVFTGRKIILTGEFKRQLEIINELAFIVEEEIAIIENTLLGVDAFSLIERNEKDLLFNSSSGFKLRIFSSDKNNIVSTLLQTSSSEPFFEALKVEHLNMKVADEAVFFNFNNISFIPAYAREDAATLEIAKNGALPVPIEATDIKGIIHCHSNWSDGSNTIEEMATAAINLGLEYLAISDHSKTAFYAQGLSEERIRAQHKYIDELNVKFAPFKIFKSIESDILSDGSLDYDEEILKSFDLVIASIHSNLKMTEEKAMMRLINAIENPYTHILGHMTGRLLLSRPGYPVNHEKIIDACAANNVAIELNANPSRLDIDWRFIKKALDKNVLISINPDSHSADTLMHTRYGVKVAQKALLTKEQNLSSFSLAAFEDYLATHKK
ncbi:MAG TPA: PHP domain-containing protein [Ferruginibacter sp.]|nr:PHP domain-containing protein [Ferruginibacter sp.]HRE63695.1 PHP domain-containing protein [Ferruginibacter sp.]